MSMISIILPVAVSAVLTVLLLPFVIRFSYRKHLFDSVNERTVHSGVVPRLGGGAFLLASLVALLMSLFMGGGAAADGAGEACGFTWHGVALTGAVLLIYLAGLWDDICTLSYKLKFLSQFLAAVLVVVGGNCWVADFQGLLGIGVLPAVVGMPLSVLLIMFVINAFNLIDGIDGLASALGCVASLLMGLMFVIHGQVAMGVTALALAAALLVFFFFNKLGRVDNKTKVFMGDGGSQALGLLIAIMVVSIANGDGMQAAFSRYSECPIVGSATSAQQVPFVLAFSLIIVPCFDAMRVMFCRIFKGHNPFLADQTHIHHKLLRMGCNASVALTIIVLLSLMLVAVNMIIACSDLDVESYYNINIILLIDLMIWCTFDVCLNIRVRQREELLK